METTVKKIECQFCCGENQREEENFAEVLEQVSYRDSDNNLIEGKACLFCIEFLMNHDDDITELKVGI
jgi:hypothetical protein